MEEMIQVSGTYKQPATMKAQTVEVEHCSRMDPSSEWVLEANCRSGKEDWKSLLKVCPGAEVEEKSNRITVTLPPVEKELEVAAFGKPGEKDVKRMQMAILGRKPVGGKKWIISVYLCDDTVMAFENLFQKEEKNGKKLLAPRSGLFVANTVDDIRIQLNALEPGWEIKESNTKIIKSTDAWNPPENATDFPSCCFEICHVDETQESFSCTVTASHGTETSKQTIMAVFKQIEKQKIDEMRLPEKVTYTLPSCDASDMKTMAKLRSGSVAGETLLEPEELDVKLTTIPYIGSVIKGFLDNYASKYWRGLAENLSLSPMENVPEYHDGLSPTLDLLERLSNTQPITVETLLRCLETSKRILYKFSEQRKVQWINHQIWLAG